MRRTRAPWIARGGVLSMILVFTLAACSSAGSGSSQAAGESQSPSQASSTAPSATAEPATLKLGVSNPTFSFTPIWVGAAKDSWAGENLTVDLTVFQSGSDAQVAMLGDAIQLSAGAYTEPINLTAQGKQTVAFGSIQGALPFRLMTKPELTDVKQLIGKTLGVSKVGSLTDQITRIVLQKEGIDPDQLKYQQAGSSPDRLAALQAGAFDGTVLDSPAYLEAQKAGMNTLIDLSTQLAGFPFEVLYAKKEVIEANQDAFARFMRGYIKAAQYATDPANKDEVIKIVTEATGIKADAVKLAYEETIKDFPPTAAFTIDGIKLALDGTKQYTDLPGLDNVTPEDLYYPDLQEKAAAALGLK